jgi:acetylcholinesterase
VTKAQLQKLIDLYPVTPSQSSPAGLGPQYERITAITGDYSFQCQRRQLLDKITAPKWNYFTEQEIPASVLGGTPIGSILSSTGLINIPVLGSFHACDVILNWFGTLPGLVSRNSYHLMGSLVAFTHNLDPNTAGMDDVPNWSQYDSSSRQTMNWKEEGDIKVITDDYREEQMNYLSEIGDSIRI